MYPETGHLKTLDFLSSLFRYFGVMRNYQAVANFQSGKSATGNEGVPVNAGPCHVRQTG